MMTVLMIRDFPDFPLGWLGAYVHGKFKDQGSAKAALIAELKMRGGKYGGMLLSGEGIVLTFDRNGLLFPHQEGASTGI